MAGLYISGHSCSSSNRIGWTGLPGCCWAESKRQGNGDGENLTGIESKANYEIWR